MRQIGSYYQKRAKVLILFVEKWQGQCPERKGHYSKISLGVGSLPANKMAFC